MSIIAYLSLADFETSTFLSQDNVQYAHSLEPSSCPFFSVHSNSIAKVRNLFDTAKLFLYYFFQQAYFYEISTKKALKFATAEKDNASTFPIHDNLNAYILKRYYHHQRNHNLLHTLSYIKRVILHVSCSTNHSLLSLPDYEHKSKKIISISQISKPTLYEMPFCMYQMIKWRRYKSKLQLAHNS